MDRFNGERGGKKWSVIDPTKIKMTEGEGVVIVAAKNGVVWVAVRKGPDWIGNAYKPDAARDLARTLLAEADTVGRDEEESPATPDATAVRAADASVDRVGGTITSKNAKVN